MKFSESTITLKRPHTTLALYGLGDFHADDKGFHKSLLLEYLHEIRANPSAYIILMGDYWNLFRQKIRSSLRAEIEALADLDGLVTERTEQFYHTFLEPVRDRILGALDGNHHFEFSSGDTDTQLLCRLCGTKYLGNLAGLRLRIEGLHGIGHGLTLTGMVHHGHWGSGASTPGGDLNSLDNKARPWDVDFVFAGHTHQRKIHIDEFLTIPKSGTLFPVARQKALVRTGSFLRQYVPDTQERSIERFSERKLFRPAQLGTDPLFIRVRDRGEHGRHIRSVELRNRP